MKKILSVFLAILLFVGIMPTAVFSTSTLDEAMAEVNVYAKNDDLNWLTMNGSVKTQKYTYYNYTSDLTKQTTEIPAYCVDPRLYGVPALVSEGTAIKYSADSTVSDPKVCGILANGYPHQPLSTLGLESVEEAYYATKTALWIYLLGNWSIDALGINPNLTGTDKETAQRVLQATKDIYWRGMQWDELVSPKLTASPDRDTAYSVTIDGQNYYQQIFTITSETWAIESVKVSLAENAPDGTKILNMNNQETDRVEVTTSGADGYQGQIKVVYPAESIEGKTGTVQLNLSSVVVQYEIYYAKSLETNKYGEIQDYMLDTVPHTSITASAISRYSVDEADTVQPTNQTTLKIVKLEEGTDTPLEGAVFKVTAPDGTTVGSFSTDADGTISIPLTLTGHYTVEETSAPKWHTLSENNTQHVQVVHGQTATVTFANAPYGKLRVQKISDTGDNLEGVTIQIKNLETGETQSGQTGVGGVIEFTNLKPGSYEIRETAGIKGYVVDVNATQTTTVTAGETSSVTIINKALPSLQIIKYDRTTLETMPDVTFEIWRDGTLLGQYKTDQLGEILLLDAQPGTYLVQEVQSDDSHIVDTTPQQIELTAGDGTRQLVFYNDKKPSIHLTKVDSANLSQPIANAKFKIEMVGGTYSKEFVTDQNGEIDLTDLEPGAYTVTELEAPDGYLIDEATRIIQINGNENAEFVFTNTKKPSLEIVKTDAITGTPVQGVTFTVKAVDSSTLTTVTSDANGKCLVENLEPGVYEVWEKSVPDGYLINEEHQLITLVANRTGTVQFQNYPKPSLTINKVDSITGDPIKGAKFSITYASNNTFTGESNDLGTYYTDENGQINLSKLQDGWYKVTELESAAGYAIKDSATQEVYLKAGTAKTLTFQNTPLSALVVYKYDSVTGEAVSNAVFQVKYLAGTSGTGGTVIGTYKTSVNGSFTVTGLKAGTYIVSELASDDNHVIDTAPQTAYISGKEQDVVQLYFSNSPKGNLLVKKVDSVTGEPLSDVEFMVTTSDGTVVGDANGKFVTDSSGTFTVSGITPGTTLVVKETKAKNGYILDDTAQTAKIQAGQTVTLEFRNAPKGNLIINKLDSVTKKPLAGVQFKITYADGSYVDAEGGKLSSNGLYTTDSNGQITISGITGTLIVTEIKTIDGYTIDENTRTQTVVVNPDDTQTQVFFNEPLCSLTITKLDSVTGKPVPGTTFAVKDGNGNLLGSYTTGSDGTVTVTGLISGSTVVVSESKVPSGYVLDTTPQTIIVKNGSNSLSSGNGTTTSNSGTVSGGNNLTFEDNPTTQLIIEKYITGTTTPLKGVTFLVTYSDGEVVGSSNGEYITDENGQIVIEDLEPGVTVVAKEIQTVDGYVLDTTPKSIKIKVGDAQTLRFYNTPIGGVEIIKVNADDKSQRIANTVFEIRKMDGGLVETVTTNKNGRVFLSLEDGNYYAVEIEAAKGYKLDSTPHYFTVKNGKTTTVTVTNKAVSGILIHKIDATTGNGIYGISFLLYDSTNTPIGQYTSDDSGYVYIENLEAGRYYLRELENEGYVLDTQKKTVYVKSGETTEVEWKNTPITAQIQITKKSADYNSTNGLPAGTLLEGATFEIYDKAGNLVDTIVSGTNGLAVSKPLPLGRYTIRETKAPANYCVNDTELTAYLEHEGQIVCFEVTNKSVNTSVSITKIGPKEAVAGQPVNYTFSGIANTSNVRLENFFWRDTLPAQVQLNTIVTGTYNFPGTYKIIYRVNGGEYRTLADNLSTSQNYTLDASSTALSLASNERVTEVMFVFGQAPAGFAQVEKPQIKCTAVSGLTAGSSFVNLADVGGTYNSVWIQAVSRWVTQVYAPSTTLPRTGY